MPSARAITRSSSSAFSNSRLAADDVVDHGGALVGHAQAHGARALVLAAEAAVAVLLLEGLDLVRPGGRAVGVPVVEQLLDDLGVALGVLRTGRSAPRPSRSRATRARRRWSGRSPASSARGRCPRSAARARRPGRGRAASCRAPSARCRCAARLSAREGTGPASAKHRTRRGRAETVASISPMLIGAHVSPAGGPANAVDARRRARLPLDPDLQPEPAAVEADACTPTRRSPPSRRRWRSRTSRRC